MVYGWYNNTVPKEWKPTKATQKAVESRPETKEIRKRRKKVNRTGWTKERSKAKEKRFDAFKVYLKE
jgi:hypothetical protein